MIDRLRLTKENQIAAAAVIGGYLIIKRYDGSKIRINVAGGVTAEELASDEAFTSLFASADSVKSAEELASDPAFTESFASVESIKSAEELAEDPAFTETFALTTAVKSPAELASDEAFTETFALTTAIKTPEEIIDDPVFTDAFQSFVDSIITVQESMANYVLKNSDGEVKYGWAVVTQEEFDAIESPDPNILYMIST